MKILFLDTETTGFPLYHDPSDDPRQPHLTELSFFVIDDATGEFDVEPLTYLIRPDGWDVPAETVALNGLDAERLAREGNASEPQALHALQVAWERSDIRMAFSEPFDRRICRIGFKRYAGHPPFHLANAGDEPIHERWSLGASQCVMAMAKPVAQVPAKTPGKFKSPTLVEAMKAILGEDYPETHRAFPDAWAAFRLWHAIAKPGWPLPEWKQ